jgi:hypothetical protein
VSRVEPLGAPRNPKDFRDLVLEISLKFQRAKGIEELRMIARRISNSAFSIKESVRTAHA